MEIQKIIDRAIQLKQMPFAVGVQLTVHLWLYDAALQQAQFFQSKGLPKVAQVFQALAVQELNQTIQTLQKNKSKIALDVFDLLLVALQNL